MFPNSALQYTGTQHFASLMQKHRQKVQKIFRRMRFVSEKVLLLHPHSTGEREARRVWIMSGVL
jgi:hypothetical protein